MKLIFFLNSLSPHQLPYIQELPLLEQVKEVIVVAPEKISPARIKSGWNVDHFLSNPQIRFLVSPSHDEITDLFDTHNAVDTICLFSGIKDFPAVYQWFLVSMHYNVRRFLIKERPNTFAFNCANGKPLRLHHLRFLFRERYLARHVEGVFAMGMEAVKYYEGLFDWKVFPFCYCTETVNVPPSDNSGPLRLCYVGSLEWWKDVKTILLSIAQLPKKQLLDIEFSIVGTGTQRDELEALSKSLGLKQITFLGGIPNSQIAAFMAKHDAFVLASIYDGWGAVVNEALLSGLYTICSKKAGACDAVGDELGHVFEAEDVKALAGILSETIENRQIIREQRSNRKVVAQSRIGGGAVAQYMVECLVGKVSNRPWHA